MGKKVATLAAWFFYSLATWGCSRASGPVLSDATIQPDGKSDGVRDGLSPDTAPSAALPTVSNAAPFSRHVVAAHYHTFIFDWSNEKYATFIPKVGPDHPAGTQHPGYYYHHPTKGWTDEMIEQHVVWAQKYGVDVLIVHFVAVDANEALIERIADIFQRRNQKWFFFTESPPLVDPAAAKRLADALVKHKTNKMYVRIDGRPALMTYTAAYKTPAELAAFRTGVESTAGPVYLMADLLSAALVAPELKGACGKVDPKPATGSYEVSVRMRSMDGLLHNFSLHVVDTTDPQQEKVLDVLSKATASASYAWYSLGKITYDGKTPLRLSDWSDPNLGVDALRLTGASGELIKEAEDVAGNDSTVFDDAAASGTRAVTHKKPEGAIYAWWVLPLGYRSEHLSSYWSAVDAISDYGFSPKVLPVLTSGCLDAIYDYFRGQKIPFTGWGSPGFRCDYAAWCISEPAHGPTSKILKELIGLGAAQSNWIVIQSWNEFSSPSPSWYV